MSNGRVYDVRICPTCGNEFERKAMTGQKYCNPVCRKRANREKDNASIKQWQDNNPESRMVSYARARAKGKGLECTITKNDITIPEFCPIFGFKLERNVGNGHGGRFNSPSLDRIDSSLGYVEGNVQVISQLANAMKSDATPEQLLQFAEWIITTYGETNSVR